MPLPPEVAELGNFEMRIMRNLRAAVDDWDEVCSALGQWEAEHLIRDEFDSAKERHRSWVTKLISWGQLMQQLTEHPDFADHAIAARVKKRLRHLEDKRALWHGQMTSEEEDRILQAAFS